MGNSAAILSAEELGHGESLAMSELMTTSEERTRTRRSTLRHPAPGTRRTVSIWSRGRADCYALSGGAQCFVTVPAIGQQVLREFYVGAFLTVAERLAAELDRHHRGVPRHRLLHRADGLPGVAGRDGRGCRPVVAACCRVGGGDARLRGVDAQDCVAIISS